MFLISSFEKDFQSIFLWGNITGVHIEQQYSYTI